MFCFVLRCAALLLLREALEKLPRAEACYILACKCASRADPPPHHHAARAKDRLLQLTRNQKTPPGADLSGEKT
jgi:hypothetical protein